jgi:hypothetical protein
MNDLGSALHPRCSRDREKFPHRHVARAPMRRPGAAATLGRPAGAKQFGARCANRGYDCGFDYRHMLLRRVAMSTGEPRGFVADAPDDAATGQARASNKCSIVAGMKRVRAA